jgi:hypothetical protein
LAQSEIPNFGLHPEIVFGPVVLEKKGLTPSYSYLDRQSTGNVVFLLFSDKNFEKSHEKSFEKSMELGRKFFNKDKNIGSLLKKISSRRSDRYHENLRL